MAGISGHGCRMMYTGVLWDTAEQIFIYCECPINTVTVLGTCIPKEDTVQSEQATFLIYCLLGFSAQFIFPLNPFDQIIFFQKHDLSMFLCQTQILSFCIQRSLLVYPWPHNSSLLLTFRCSHFKQTFFHVLHRGCDLVRWLMRWCSVLLCSPGPGPWACFLKQIIFLRRNYV